MTAVTLVELVEEEQGGGRLQGGMLKKLYEYGALSHVCNRHAWREQQQSADVGGAYRLY